MVRSLAEAIEELRRDPSQPVETDVGGLHVEIRVKIRSAADVFREAGVWEGESAEAVVERIAAARRDGGAEAPEL